MICESKSELEAETNIKLWKPLFCNTFVLEITSIYWQLICLGSFVKNLDYVGCLNFYTITGEEFLLQYVCYVL